MVGWTDDPSCGVKPEASDRPSSLGECGLVRQLAPRLYPYLHPSFGPWTRCARTAQQVTESS